MEDAAPEFGPNGAVLNSGIIPSDKVEEYRTGRTVFEKRDTSLHPKWLKILRYVFPVSLLAAYILVARLDLLPIYTLLVIFWVLGSGLGYLYTRLCDHFSRPIDKDKFS